MTLGRRRLFRLLALLVAIVILCLVGRMAPAVHEAPGPATIPISYSGQPRATIPLARATTKAVADESRDCDTGSKVVLAGNRPVGTYLCSYFTADVAVPFPGGCRVSCFGGAFTCEVHDKASPPMLLTADIIVNHFGPVPQKDSAKKRPFLTVFYNGESNSSDPKRSKPSYHAQYDLSVSFHRARPLYFTWTKRFEPDFNAIAEGRRSFPNWADQRTGIAIFVSRCKKGGREAVIRGLAAHFPVYSFGKCARTHTVEQEHPECAAISSRYPQKLCIFAKYKFILALDNSREIDYVTEKVYHGLLAGSIPVYDGAPNADAFLPGGWSSVVRLELFRTGESLDFAGLGKHLHDLSAQARPLQLSWRDVRNRDEWGAEFVDNLQHDEPTCQMCRMAQQKRCRLEHEGRPR
jgi:hypothetical protein